jgi:hypothetical protein
MIGRAGRVSSPTMLESYLRRDGQAARKVFFAALTIPQTLAGITDLVKDLIVVKLQAERPLT